LVTIKVLFLSAARSGEDLRTVGESEALLGLTKKRPATAGRRFARGHQIQPLSEEEQERSTLPFNGTLLDPLPYCTWILFQFGRAFGDPIHLLQPRMYRPLAAPCNNPSVVVQ